MVWWSRGWGHLINVVKKLKERIVTQTSKFLSKRHSGLRAEIGEKKGSTGQSASPLAVRKKCSILLTIKWNCIMLYEKPEKLNGTMKLVISVSEYFFYFALTFQNLDQ